MGYGQGGAALVGMALILTADGLLPTFRDH